MFRLLAEDDQSLKSVPSDSMLIVLFQAQFCFSMCILGFHCIPGNVVGTKDPQGRTLSSRNTQSHWVPMGTQRRNNQKHLIQWFSNFEGLKNHLEGLLQHRLLSILPSPHQFLIHYWNGAWEFSFLTSFQVMLMLTLLVQGPHFENHWWNPVDKPRVRRGRCWIIHCGSYTIWQLKFGKGSWYHWVQITCTQGSCFSHSPGQRWFNKYVLSNWYEQGLS